MGKFILVVGLGLILSGCNTTSNYYPERQSDVRHCHAGDCHYHRVTQELVHRHRYNTGPEWIKRHRRLHQEGIPHRH